MSEPTLGAEVERFFRERLPVLPGFEDRPQQRQMALAVARAFEDEEILVAEAGTGTGKSLAYLVPALLWRARGGPEPVVVATRTLNLQQQILDVDVPRLQGSLGLQFRAVQARGWSNYLCLRRLHGLPRSGDLTPGEAGTVQAVADHLARGGDGLRAGLAVGDELWSRLACDSTACGRQRCPFYGRCLLFRERQALEGADLVVTNHALLLSDLALRREGASGILPGLTRVVLDEAHHLEEAATDHLGYSFLRSDFHRFLQQLYRPRATTEEGGFLAGLRLTLAGAPLASHQRQDLLARVDRGLLAPLPALAGAAEEFLHHLAGRIPREVEKVPLDPAWFTTVEGDLARQAGLVLGARLGEASGALREIAQGLEEAPAWEVGQGLRLEIQGFAQRLDSIRSEVEFCLFPESPDWVYWAESSARDLGLGAAPLDVGPQLSSLLFGLVKTAVLTSATLTVRGSTTFLEERVGLDLHSERLERLVVDSPFDYRHQALVAVARDMPDPGDPSFAEIVAEPVADLVAGLGGRTFLLVTSWKMLRDLEARLTPRLAEQGIAVLCQGRADRSVLLNQFRSGGRYLLLGTDSFWEGVDVPGEALSCVIMARLPFRVPTEPIHQARSGRQAQKGRSPFSHYHLPLAVVKFRQGFGRLIRTTSDRGVVLVLDGRLLSKAYGRTFLDSLPGCHRQEGPLDRLVRDCLDWLLGLNGAAEGMVSASPGRRPGGSTSRGCEFNGHPNPGGGTPIE